MKEFKGTTKEARLVVKIGNHEIPVEFEFANMFAGKSSSGNSKLQISGKANQFIEIDGVKYIRADKYFIQLNIVALNQEAVKNLQEILKDEASITKKEKRDEIVI